MIDTHAHLGADAADVLERARAAGVTRVVCVATTVAGARDVLALAEREDGVFACLGVHPHEAGAPGDLGELRTLLEHPKVVAVGETGLDYYRDYAPHDAQQRIFVEQLGLARELRKPVVIHTRAADEDTRMRLVEHEGDGRPALLLVAAATRGRARPRLVRLVRRKRHVQERV